MLLLPIGQIFQFPLKIITKNFPNKFEITSHNFSNTRDLYLLELAWHGINAVSYISDYSSEWMKTSPFKITRMLFIVCMLHEQCYTDQDIIKSLLLNPFLSAWTHNHLYHFQVLAGPGLFDSVCNGSSWHAEAACGGLALSAQLSSRHRLLLRRPGPRPLATQGQLPQVPHQRGKRGVAVCVWCSDVIIIAWKSLKWDLPLWSGPHEDLCSLRLHQGHLGVHVYRPASVQYLHSGKTHKENAAAVSG